jgi:predicted ATPase/class 3 adenylate cyclase
MGAFRLRSVGTRVFLFTDIEGSTKLWSDYPTVMPEALARHDDSIATAVASAGGRIFKHTGDGVCAVFTSAPDALNAAASAQRSLTAAEWGGIGRVRVRMAVHAGDAEPRGEDWSGPALNRTARLLGIAHGGQILVSSSAYELASDALDQDISVTDLGVHSLRGLARPEHVWQLTGDGLERTFPPLRSLEGVRGWLPTVLTSFVGREAEREVVAEHVRVGRLVTIVGPGGVGKTRLATEVGRGMLDKFADGVWLFELAGLAAADGLEALVMATIGVSGGSTASPREALLAVIRTWRALFIFDNCEHLCDGAADLVGAMLAAGADLVVLATSRERLRIPGERVVVLEPLPVERDGAAVQLFLERAGALRPIDESAPGVDAVAGVCRRLDGMPLAIELAAARSGSMTPAEIERHLDRRFRLLAGPRGADDRHGSLQRVLDWSYDLLSDECRTFFDRLSVFAGTFDAPAAHAVAGPDDEIGTLDMLDELVSKSLLTSNHRGDRTSYRLLETMRQYGAQRSTAPDVEQVEARHTEYFAALALAAWDGCRGRESQHWLDLLHDQLDDVRAAFERATVSDNTDAAMRIAAGLFMFNQTRRLQEIYGWVDRALAMPGASEHPLYHRAALHRAYGRFIRGSPAVAAREIRGLLDALDQDDPVRPMAVSWLVAAGGTVDGMADAIGEASTNLVELERLGAEFDYDRAEALWNWCTLAFVTGTPDCARATELLSLGRELGNVRAIAGGLLQAGVADPDPVRGRQLLAEARDLTARSRDSLRHGYARAFLGALESETNPAAGLAVVPELVDHARRTGLELLLLQIPRSFFGAFSALGRHETIAMLDGVAVDTPIRPAVSAAAIATARHTLGADRYDELKRQGADMTTDDLAAFLIVATADV